MFRHAHTTWWRIRYTCPASWLVPGRTCPLPPRACSRMTARGCRGPATPCALPRSRLSPLLPFPSQLSLGCYSAYSMRFVAHAARVCHGSRRQLVSTFRPRACRRQCFVRAAIAAVTTCPETGGGGTPFACLPVERLGLACLPEFQNCPLACLSVCLSVCGCQSGQLSCLNRQKRMQHVCFACHRDPQRERSTLSFPKHTCCVRVFAETPAEGQ